MNLNKLEDTGSGSTLSSRTWSAPYNLAEHYPTIGNIPLDRDTLETTRIMDTDTNTREQQAVRHHSHKHKIRDNITSNKQIQHTEQITTDTRPAKKDQFVTPGTKPGLN